MNNPQLALTDFVDVLDRQDLFEELGNERVLELSRLGGGGFSGLSVLKRSTGIDCRRILRPGIAPIDLAISVADQLRRDIGFDFEDVPAVLLCHSHVEESRSVELAADLADYLGLPKERVRGYNLGCAGFMKLIKDGAEIAEQAGPGKHVPLLSVEVPEQWHDAADKAFCGIVSAGAAGTTIWQGPGHKLLSFDAREVNIPADKRNDGRPLFTKDFCEGFDFRGMPLTREVMHMDGESVFLNGVELMLAACHEAMDGIDDPSRVVVVPHQPSGKLLRTLIATAKLEMPDTRFVNNLPGFGNMLSSAIPVALSKIDEVAECNDINTFKSGDLVVLTAAGICMPKRADHMMQGFATLAW
ncbi:MAG: 3-oxoacyl-[acyl-carrier-protein] synthase III C-terminal domain-containing protein [Planctomycetaceae bacterium]